MVVVHFKAHLVGGGQYQSVPVFHGGANPNYAENGEGPKMDIHFNDQTIRAAFVRKVFIMVGVMVSAFGSCS